MKNNDMTTSEFRRQFGQALDMVKQGTEIILTNHNQHWVCLKPPAVKCAEKISAFYLRQNLRSCLNKVRYSGHACAIVRKGKTIAIIHPAQDMENR